MQAKLSNPNYSYVRGGAATVSCTLQVLADDGATVIDGTTLSYQANLDRPDFRELVTAEFARQAQEYIDQLKVVAGLVYSQFGTMDFNTAAGMILSDAEQRVVI